MTIQTVRGLYDAGLNKVTIDQLLALDSSADSAQGDADAAQTTADGAVTDASDAQATADAAQTDATSALTNAATAQTDLEANNVSVENLSQIKWTDSAGTWPADDSDDHVLSFKRQGVEIATHTIRAVFTQATGVWTVTSQAESGETTVETISGSGSSEAKAVISHTGSGIIGKVTLFALDQSTAGGATL